jgi:hypothetical protein
LHYNQFSGAIPDSIGNLAKLETLSLSFNRFSGIPNTIGNLKSLQLMYIHENLISGSLPYEIGGLINLTELHMNANQFSGPIPDSLGNLAKLKTLFMQQNNFEGPIPEKLSNLAILNFSHDQRNYDPFGAASNNNGGNRGIIIGLILGIIVAALFRGFFLYRRRRKTLKRDIPLINLKNSEDTIAPLPHTQQDVDHYKPKYPDSGSPFPTPPESLMRNIYKPESNQSNYPKSIFSSFSNFQRTTSTDIKSTEMFRDGIPDKIIYFSEGDKNLDRFIELLNFFFLPKDIHFNTRGSHRPIEADELQVKAGDNIKVISHNFDGWALGFNESTRQKGVFPLTITYPRFATKFVLIHVADMGFDESKTFNLIESSKIAYPKFIETYYMNKLDLGLVKSIRNGLADSEEVLPFIFGNEVFVKEIEAVFQLQDQ